MRKSVSSAVSLIVGWGMTLLHAETMADAVTYASLYM